MIDSNRDQVIVEEYVRFNVPADKIPADATLSEEFLQRVNNRLSSAEKFTPVELNSRLINLRRRGADHGGLPRIRRRYNGRA